MKPQIFILLSGIYVLMCISCTSTQISGALKTYKDFTNDEEPLTTSEVTAGLKEALVIGARNSTALTSEMDGFFGNPEIKIPFPPEIKEVETKLRQIGMNKLVDDFTLSINRAAEKASAEATELFVEAIKEMTVEDAWNILEGEDDAATQYLRNKTSDELQSRFYPVIEEALESVNATRYYQEITSTYNKIPFVDKVDTDLTNYVTGKTLDGLFLMVAVEEAKIRKDPLARTTDLLKRVFKQDE